ncbi:MAG: hypothetical protein ACTSRG_20275 [Candidatus Helarchaeota archaeon]
MTKKNDILELVAKKPMESKDIAVKLNIKINLVWSYLSELTKDNKIEVVNDKKPYEYRSNTPLRYLIDLYNFMGENMKFREDKITEIKKNREILQKIKEMIA